ncbi:DUF1599 domain-containing protein [Adhaeribacter pallidiroseus]|uniref:Nucleotide modification associated domain-containing protein n=1 Tax=Adhaeribacter pallidiroseus TaxID=2072847 RepID=A0A369QHW5_9BACT|nr:DUF1599 domain-containing protein [Adhaeribacter pallidiroseus]RDC64314.1 hypothetical protein AHMF7616_02927 [Adhaeribacter pallidiroseus]
MINQTLSEYKRVISACHGIFLKKTIDYGTAWRILRLPSITDQIFIKAQRIRSIQEKGVQKIAEDITSEFVGIVNYCVIALMQMDLTGHTELEIPAPQVAEQYNAHIDKNIELLLAKNHDYGEAWRDMRVSSITDIILMKLYRTKQIEDNQGHTLISEGVEANYRDMINYAVFALIKLNFAADESN